MAIDPSIQLLLSERLIIIGRPISRWKLMSGAIGLLINQKTKSAAETLFSQTAWGVSRCLGGKLTVIVSQLIALVNPTLVQRLMSLWLRW
jgi:hypothetical protein